MDRYAPDSLVIHCCCTTVLDQFLCRLISRPGIDSRKPYTSMCFGGNSLLFFFIVVSFPTFEDLYAEDKKCTMFNI